MTMSKPTLIITSIAGSDHPVLQQYAKESADNEVSFIVVGDMKSPSAFHLPNCQFLSVEKQKKLGFSITENLPFNHYARKNVGYLVAMLKGAEIIVETDDDNLPFAEFWSPRTRQIHAHSIVDQGWVNVYKYFTDKHIWPRGFALEHILDPIPPLQGQHLVDCPIQQGLAGKNPDVDAIYRFTQPLPIDFYHNNEIALGRGSICPFNSQNTTWFKDAFLLMYLPSHCSFRMTDIWRSFIAQRIAWTNNWNILFHQSTVWQERNYHNLNQDFEDEIPGYLNNLRICRELQELRLDKGKEYLPHNLITCYQKLIDLGLIAPEEMTLVEAWIENAETALC